MHSETLVKLIIERVFDLKPMEVLVCLQDPAGFFQKTYQIPTAI